MMTERIFWLMTHPEAKCKEYMERWETSRSNFYRDKRYIRDRLWNYSLILNSELKKLRGYEHVINTLKAEQFNTVEFIKEELTRYKNYRLKVAKGEIK